MVNELTGISIDYIACCVPANTIKTEDISYFSSVDAQKFIKGTGISKRRIATPEICASDLCEKAAREILEKSKVKIEDIDVLIVVTQTGDFQIPNTSSLLQHKLGMKQSTLAFDINMGCSGYVYGLGVIGSLLKTLNLKKALLLAGDTSSKTSNPDDRSVWPLFGDAGSATLLSNDGGSSKVSFEFFTDGSRYEAIIKPSSGYRKDEKNEPSFLKLDSIGIFNFTIKEVPESIRRVLEKNNEKIENVDYFFLHQANKVINETIGKKLRIETQRLLSSIEEYGNTSSASIPMTMTANLTSFQKDQKIIISGFGVGLSWATALLENMETTILPIREL